MITIANADKALKTYYLDAISAQLDSISPFYAAIDKHSAEVYGKEVKVAVVKGDNSRVVAGAEDGDLPAAGQNSTIEISDKALRAAKNSEGAFVDLVNAEMEGLISSAKVNFSRMLYGDGNGFIATITETGDNGIKVNNIGRLSEGMHVDLRSGSGVMSGGENVVVSDVNYSTGYIKFATEIEGVLAGKSLYVHGAYASKRCSARKIFTAFPERAKASLLPQLSNRLLLPWRSSLKK